MFKPTKLIALSLFLVLVLGFFFLTRAADETIVYTTYYPSPYGSYTDMYVSGKMGIGTTEAGSARLTVENGTISHASNNTFYGNNTSVATHIDLGIASVTGTNGKNYEYCSIGGGIRNNATGVASTVIGGTADFSGANYSSIGAGEANNAAGNYSTVSGGSLNIATDDYSAVLGGISNNATGLYSVVGAGRGNNASGDNSTIGGGWNNAVTTFGSVIGGGFTNNISNTPVTDGYTTIAGGWSNRAVNSKYIAIGGGRDNLASGEASTISGGTTGTASGYASTIGGGYYNIASGLYATVLGGYNNSATGNNTTVGGGFGNLALGNYSAIGGGSNNTAFENYSIIGGGILNNASGGCSAIIGGRSNIAGPGLYAFVGGGLENTASGFASVVSGGAYNKASGDYSVSGGIGNNASGICSWALGRGANADHDYSFVWAGIGSSAYASNSSNTFNVWANSFYFRGNLTTFDLAEHMDVPGNGSVEQMDLVSIAGENLLGKSLKPYDPNLVGVISSNKTTTLHLGTAQDPLPGTQRLPVALVGRCFVKVCAESGSIELGDAITSSSIPGIGMKAAKSGKIIGYAMQKAEFKDAKEIKEIVVFVSAGSYFSQEDINKLGKTE